MDKNKKFLRIDLLRPGDIILTRDGVKASKMIAKFTDGPFSHASMLINGAVRLESASDGVGYSPIKKSKCEYHPNYEQPGKSYWILEDVSFSDKIMVLRHDDLINENDDVLSSELFKLSQKYIGKEYPELKELSYASSKNVLTRFIVKSMLSVVDRFRGKTVINPGPFCSMLIGLIYSDLNIELFKSNRLPHEISPNDFLNSNLNEVNGVICNEDPSKENNEELLNEINSYSANLSRDKVLPQLVIAGRVMKNMEKLIHSFEDFNTKIEELIFKLNKPNAK